MKIISKLIIAGVFTSLLVSTNLSHAASWKDLDEAAAKAALSDITIKSSKFKVYLGADGKQIGRWDKNDHTGNFTINDKGHYCSTWQTAGFEKVGCWSMKQKKKKIKFKPESGRANSKFTVKVKKGNKL